MAETSKKGDLARLDSFTKRLLWVLAAYTVNEVRALCLSIGPPAAVPCFEATAPRDISGCLDLLHPDNRIERHEATDAKINRTSGSPWPSLWRGSTSKP